ncbi:MAG: single-stranded DNA-binding protein [Chloroflexi bacterium]|nr:single-stranded DNA-binding protein [Chloroflexota bacterium]
MNKVMLVGRLTRDPELRSLPSGKHVATFTVATNEYRGGNGERTEYHPCVAWDRLAEICGQFLTKGQLVDVEGRLQTRQWDDDAGKGHLQATGRASEEGRAKPSSRTSSG